MKAWQWEKDLKVAANFRLICPVLAWRIAIGISEILRRFENFAWWENAQFHSAQSTTALIRQALLIFSASKGLHCLNFRTKEKKINTLGFWNLNLLDQKVPWVAWVKPCELDNLKLKNKLCLHENPLKIRTQRVRRMKLYALTQLLHISSEIGRKSYNSS